MSPASFEDARASAPIDSTRTGLSMLRWGGPVALFELACEVSLRREATAQRDVSDGAGGMAKIDKLPVRQCKPLLPDPLRDAAFVLLEHSVQIAERHCHVVCDGLGIEFTFRKMFGDEAFRPQKTKSQDIVAALCVVTPRPQQQLQPRADLVPHGRCRRGQRLVYETEDPFAQRL